jgi:hypothetical protein
MIKRDGKEFYTFVGLINRMDACANGGCFITNKDIPEEVEFKGSVYELNREKNSYYLKGAGVPLAEAVAKVYGDDLYKYLRSHAFIVTPKPNVSLTCEEREFIRISNAVLKGGVGIKHIYISTDSYDKILGIRFKDDSGVFIPVGFNQFTGIPAETELTLSDLKIYE